MSDQTSMGESQNPSSPAPEKKNGLKKVVLVGLLAAGAVGAYSMTKKDSTTPDAAQNTPPEANGSTPPAVVENTVPVNVVPTEAVAAIYKDGEYSVVGAYKSPAGPEEIDVKVTLKGDVITAIDVTPKAENEVSKKKQANFVDNYKPYVFGKKLDAVKVDKISGASLTTGGFNAALEKVKTQAKG
jgi:uncharacterized protein with FMN-binding domain